MNDKFVSPPPTSLPSSIQVRYGRNSRLYWCVFWTLEWQLRGNVIIRKAQSAIQAGDCRPRRRSSSWFPLLAPTQDSFGGFGPRMFGGGVTSLSKQLSS